MNHIKLFEELTIPKKEFPEDGYELNIREKQILEDLVGKKFLKQYTIRKEDNYYYTSYYFYNQFDGFNELKDYISCKYYLSNNNSDKLLDLLKSTDLDPSFDDNYCIRLASKYGYIEVVRLLLEDPRVDPSDYNNYAIRWSRFYGHTEIVKLLLQDPRIDSSERL